jgi:hypothetical protein
MKTPAQRGAPDDFQTPADTLRPLIKHLSRRWTVWECAAGNGNLVRGLRADGFRAIGTDILTGTDFLSAAPRQFDCIVTNPPFSLKQEFLARAYSLGKPFAFLLPLTTLETAKRQSLFREHGVELILLDRRINFETPSGRGSGSWFATAWFTWGLKIGAQLSFEAV